MYEETQENIRKMSEKIWALRGKAEAEKRALSAQEAGIITELEAAIDDERLKLPANAPLTLQANGSLGGSNDRNSRPFALKRPTEKKDYGSLFGNRGYQWPDKETDFFSAVLSGRHHPGLIKNATMTETVPGDGGFLVPVEYSRDIHAVSLENEIVMPRCYVQPMSSNEFHLPAMNIGDHSSSLFGGFTASYTAETGTISEANPQTRDMVLNAKKLTGLLRFSNELASDIPGGSNQIVQICGKGLSWYRDKAFLKGTGAGEPLGIMNADCVIEVDPESGQAANTIQYANLTKMLSRLWSGSFNNSVWVCHQSTIPQLLELTIAIGTGGSVYPVLSESNGIWKILTRPVIFTEKTAVLGDRGDVMLCDFSQYVVGLRGEMRFDVSIHPGFLTDELYARLIERHDGQPLWDSALTLEDGSTTVSPFVVLGAR